MRRKAFGVGASVASHALTTIECFATDFTAIVRSAVEQGEKLVRSRWLEFVANLPADTIEILAEPDALRRAMLILIDNAAKYTSAGGVVSVALEQNNGFAIASVSDTGIGISKADFAHIFDRFWRADKARSREQGGAGLGLSIARWIVETHGGSIEVRSEPGKGSIFCVKIPRDRKVVVERNTKVL